MRLEKIERDFLWGGGGLEKKIQSCEVVPLLANMERKRVGGVLVKLELGNRRRMKFWMDKWCRDEPLCVSFPSLYTLGVAKEAWVADLWVQHGKRGH
ncbi:hypothetical protein CK203_045355 [Vitis vinifera]|uniref:Reverse transcriptase zinc-binding domain-containing protein n=1 Tax=Vitis vinifera TaxID=29760 RepID=A0A438H978_VITVI|nr:hypothetical protein CK203_045355 [Vitis vinifera]